MRTDTRQYQEAVDAGFDPAFEAEQSAYRKAKAEGRTGVSYKIEDDPWYAPGTKFPLSEGF